MARTARNWRDVRADAIKSGRVTEESIVAARRKQDRRVLAYRLQQIRKGLDLTQEEIAETMAITQSRVSKIERGDIDHVELATLRGYVAALGGHLRMTADFDGGEVQIALPDDARTPA